MRRRGFLRALWVVALVGTVGGAGGCSRDQPAPPPASGTSVALASEAATTSASSSANKPVATAVRPPKPPKILAVKGFATRSAPAAVTQQLTAAMAKLNGVSKPAMTGITVTATKKPFGSLAVVALSADHDQDVETRKAYVSGLAAKAGGRGYVKKGETNSGQPAYYVLGGGACVYVWYVKGTIAMLITTRPVASARAFAKQYIAAA